MTPLAPNPAPKLDIVTFLGLIGEQNCAVQFIDQCAQAMNYGRKTGTKITFGTDAIGPGELVSGAPTKKLGIVIWVDRAASNKILREWPPEAEAEGKAP